MNAFSTTDMFRSFMAGFFVAVVGLGIFSAIVLEWLSKRGNFRRK